MLMKKALFYIFFISFFLLFLPLSLLGVFAREFLGYLKLKTSEANLAPGQTITYNNWIIKLKGADFLALMPDYLVLRAYSPQVEIETRQPPKKHSNLKLPRILLKNFRTQNLRHSGLKGLKIKNQTDLSFLLTPQTVQGKTLISWNSPGPDFTFWVIGDPHYGWIGRKEILPAILNAAQKFKPLFLVITGDLTASGRKEQFEEISRLLSSVGLPVYTVPGNHDMMDQTPQPSEVSSLKIEPASPTLYRRFFGPSYYSFELGGHRLIFLDTSFARLYDRQLYWLKNRSQKSALWFFHIPPFEPRPFGHHCFLNREETGKLTSFLRADQPEAIFCAHIHGAYRYQLYGIPFYITGGAGAPLIGNPEKHGYFHYLEVKTASSGITAWPHRIGLIGTPLQYRILNRIIEPLCWELYQNPGLKNGIQLFTLIMFLGLIYLGVRKDKIG